MPISRALLNRLRLPYKALDIQGSKGDVLYIPDDVSVDLSVMHGLHNGDMVPVKSDADGVVSVVVESNIDFSSVKQQDITSGSFLVDSNIRTYGIDTSKYLNYVARMNVDSSNDNTATITASIFRQWRNTGNESIISFTLNATPNTKHTLYMLSSDTTVSINKTYIQHQLDHSGKQAQIVLDVAGFN